MTHIAQLTRRRTITLDHVWLAAAFMLLALRPLLTPVAPHDFWWHIATGREILATGAIPVIDQFSFTRTGVPFYNQGWLAQVLMYGLHQLGGVALMVLAQAGLIMLSYGLLLRLCWLRSGRLRLCIALLMATMLLSFDNWNIRPQSYAFPLFVGFLTVLTEYRLGLSRRLWLLPLLMLLWVNLHGSFMLGLALIGIVAAGEAIRWLYTTLSAPAAERTPQQLAGRLRAFLLEHRALIVWGAITALVTLLNPRGAGVLVYVRDLLSSDAVRSLVTEWATPDIRNPNGAIFYLFVLGCLALFAWVRRWPDLTDVLLFGVFLWLAFSASRNIVWFGFVATPLLAAQLAARLPEPRTIRRNAGVSSLNGVLIGMLMLLVVLALPWFKPLIFPPQVSALVSEETPVAAVAALRAEAQPPQRLFHSEAFGSYLIWAAPERLVFIDPRIELYPYEQWMDYINLGQAREVDQLLRQYAIDGLLLSPLTQAPLIDAVRENPNWELRYEDAQAVLFVQAE